MKFFTALRRILLTFIILGNPVVAQTFIPLNVDYGIFRGPENQAYVEIYLSFLQNRLQFEVVDEGLQAQFQVDMQIKQGDALIDERRQTFYNTVAAAGDIENGSYLHCVFPFQLDAATYDFSVTLKDLNSGNKGEFLIQEALIGEYDEFLAISDIQMASAISRAEEKSDLVKNGLKVVPNPSGVFSILAPMVYYYAEVYNLEYDQENESQYQVVVTVVDQNGETVRQLSDAHRPKPGTSTVVVGGQNLVTLPNGAYFLNIKVTDESSGLIVEGRKRFAMFKPQKPDSTRQQQDLLTAVLAKKPEEELDGEFEQAMYLASNEEIQIFKGLDKEGKARFLYEFWRRRDSNPATAENEFREQYFQMVTFANEKFSAGFKPGWKSDRGRIVLTYGLPTEVERFPSSMGNKPYEQWSYDELEGGSIFVFGDLQGFGDYDLLHSTYSRELNQPDWQRLILKQDRNTDFFDTDN